MKLKYKKIIVMISMCTMGIGMVTLSMSNQSKGSTTEVEGMTTKTVDSLEKTLDTSNFNDIFSAVVAKASPTPTVTPVVEEPNPLIKNENIEIDTLITNYLKAKLTNKAESFEGIINDVNLIDIKAMKRKTKYIEKYQNLKCYTKKGPEEGTYIVYACHEVKFTDIDTLAPAMDEFYVKTDESGKLYIYMGEIDKATGQYFDEARESEDVLALIYDVNDRLREARKSDPILDAFNLKLEEAAHSTANNNTKSNTQNNTKSTTENTTEQQ